MWNNQLKCVIFSHVVYNLKRGIHRISWTFYRAPFLMVVFLKKKQTMWWATGIILKLSHDIGTLQEAQQHVSMRIGYRV